MTRATKAWITWERKDEHNSKYFLPELMLICNYLVSLGGRLPVLGGHNWQANLSRTGFKNEIRAHYIL